jgi:acetyl esterase/lipase
VNLAADAPKRAVDSFVFATDRDLSLDVYRPDDCGSAPVLVFFYGGTWQNGERHWYRFVGEQFARRGIVTVIPDYRKAPEFPFPAFVEDAAAAVAFVHRHAADWCGDPARISVAGHSAGAHVAAMLATDAQWLGAHGLAPKTALDGFIGLSGPYDFLPIEARTLLKVFPDPSRHRDSQPVVFVDGDEPRSLLFHGTNDRLVWPRNSVSLKGRLEQAGVPVTYVEIPDEGHAALLNTLGDDTDPFGVVARIEAFVQGEESAQ